MEPRFTTAEVDLLVSLPQSIGPMVIAADTGSMISAVKEMAGMAKTIAGAAAKYPQNQLIGLVHKHLNDPDYLTEAKARKESTAGRMQASTFSGFIPYFLDQVDLIVQLLEERASGTESIEYKQWVLAIGQATAEAAKEGGFMGIGGKRVSDAEQALLTQVKTHLGI